MHKHEHTGQLYSPEQWRHVAPHLSCYFPISCLSVCHSNHELGPTLQAAIGNQTKTQRDIKVRFTDIFKTRLGLQKLKQKRDLKNPNIYHLNILSSNMLLSILSPFLCMFLSSYFCNTPQLILGALCIVPMKMMVIFFYSKVLYDSDPDFYVYQIAS